jgi:DNA polymerase III epsilon subunit-like protein
MVKDAPQLSEVIGKFYKFLNTKLIVAHNAGFDMRFLNNALSDAGLSRIDQYICTMRMFRGYKKKLGIQSGGAKLSDLTAYFGLHNDHAHRALDDAKVTADAFLQMAQVLDWQAWVTGREKSKPKSTRVLTYEAHLDSGMSVEEIAQIMNVKEATVMKYLLEWLSGENYLKYIGFLKGCLPENEVCQVVLDAAKREGRVTHLYKQLDHQLEFYQIQVILKLKQMKLIDRFMEEKQ